MAALIWPVIILAGPLFFFKMLYAAAAAWSLGTTRVALYVSTPKRRTTAIMAEIPMEPGRRFVDLGCGDGRVPRAAKSAYDVDAVGYEVNPMAFVRARAACLGWGIQIYHRNFWRASLGDPVYIYRHKPDAVGIKAARGQA